jgi:hypothetical protein
LLTNSNRSYHDDIIIGNSRVFLKRKAEKLGTSAWIS